MTNFTLDPNNAEQMNAYALVAKTNQSFFLTGRAGTGKTSFINYIIDHVDKNFVVLAPTGKAAMLIGGRTIHSYFGFKPGDTTPVSMGASRHLNELYSVDTIIVDEVSMLRCDLLDAMDHTLRHVLHSHLPFGGKQMIFCGDLYQLAPVVKSSCEADVEMLMAEYGTTNAYFYKAHAFDNLKLPRIEFRKVYRQKDREFLKVLDHIRVGKYVPSEIDMLNSRVKTPSRGDEPYVILSGRRNQVESINRKRLDGIQQPLFVYEAQLSGNFKGDENDLPADMELRLKVGAQVMFCKNDSNGRWVNGTLGKVVKLSDNEVTVETDQGVEVQVEQTSWEKYSTKYDRETKKMVREIQGVFVQYPIRLAWAITIHKSQGATFDRVMLDLGSGGIFADGQLYVALTRVRSLDGLFLNSPIDASQIMINEEISSYAEKFNDESYIVRATSLGMELYDLLKSADYDGMAKVYLRESLESISRMDLDNAFSMAKGMMKCMISDEMLYGSTVGVPEFPGGAEHSDWFNAVFSLYANQFQRAFDFAEREWRRTGDWDMFYVKIRSLSMQSRHKEADGLYDELISNIGDAWDYKMAYALALHNELCVGDPGLDSLRSVVLYNVKYRTALLRFRELMRLHDQKLTLPGGNTNELVTAFNSQMTDGEFADVVRGCEKEEELSVFVRLVRYLSL